MTQTVFSCHVGIDVAKEHLDVCILPDESFLRFKNTATDIKALIKKLPQGAAVIMEATGGYERQVASILDEKGIPVCVINPKRVYHFRKSLHDKVKTDKIDSFVLARFAQQRPELRFGIYSKPQQTLLDLQHCREQLKKACMQEKNRLTQAPIKAVQQAHQAVINTLEKQITRIEAQIIEIIKKQERYLKNYQLLNTIPGIAQSIAITLIASLPEMGVLTHKALQRLVGVAPLNNDSGQFKGKRFIQGGRQAVRNALYMAALVSIRYNPIIKAYYQKKVSQGKAKKAAIVACIAKLVRIINSVIQHQKPFSFIETVG